MKRIPVFVILVFVSVLMYAYKGEGRQEEDKKKEAENGRIITLKKDMFIESIFDYKKSRDWKYKGEKPAVIDLYADWCGPCRMVAPIMKELAEEYADKVVFYKIDVDKERELASLFNASSIPLFVFIPMEGEPQFFRGAANKAVYRKAIEDVLLKENSK